jgi:hypothetical protein
MKFSTYPQNKLNYPQFYKQSFVFKIHTVILACLASTLHLSTAPTTRTTN